MRHSAPACSSLSAVTVCGRRRASSLTDTGDLIASAAALKAVPARQIVPGIALATIFAAAGFVLKQGCRGLRKAVRLRGRLAPANLTA
jgi:hypothetical protein